jgi:xanthine dehydrogenase accessory factor
MLDILQTVNHWLKSDEPIALATVTRTWGSAPRREGSKMAFKRDLAMIGSVSGGCIEGAVIEEGLAALKKGQGKLLTFGVADDTAWEVGLTCGGKINVFVEPLNKAHWELSAKAVQADKAASSITILSGDFIGEKILFDAKFQPQYCSEKLPESAISELSAIAASQSSSGQLTWQDNDIMLDILMPRPHLMIIGGVHIAIPLEAIARTMGFRVSIIDPRSAFASKARFPHVETILHTYPDEALPQLGLDKYSYLAVLTHDPKIDDKALITALATDTAYIGVLSSAKSHEKRTARLLEAGISQEQLDRLHTPIGLEIGAKSPEEIALGIMAEIIAVRNGKA